MVVVVVDMVVLHLVLDGECVKTSSRRLSGTCQLLFQTFPQKLFPLLGKGSDAELLKPVLDVFQKLVNNFFHVLHLFLSNPFPLSSVQSYLPIFIHSEALFLVNMGIRSSFVLERLRGPFKAQRKAYEGKR